MANTNQDLQRVLLLQSPLLGQILRKVPSSTSLSVILTLNQESVRQSVQLPESAATVNNLLDETYTSYSLATASLFTNFATRAELEKEHVLSQLLALFIAADKVSPNPVHPLLIKAGRSSDKNTVHPRKNQAQSH